MRSTSFRWGTALVLLVFCFVQVYGSGIAPSAYQLIMQGGVALSRRSTVNFTGTGVTCVDNAGLLRTDCTIPGVGASGVAIFSATASATNAAAAEATIIGAGAGTLTLPANYFLAAGDTVVIHAAGHYSTPIAPGTLRIRLKVGAATVLDTGAWTPLPSITQAVWELNTRITARSVGVGGTVMAQGEFKPGVGIPVGQSWPMLNTAAVALDTTAANAVALTAEWSAATGETITGTNFLVHGVTTGGGISTTGYATLQNNTAAITQRAVLNNGSGTVCVDNAGSGRSDCYMGVLVANEAGTGTTVNKLAKLTGAPSTAIISTAGDTGGAVGIVVAGAGVAGSAVIATGGTVSCVFDGATTAGNYVQISAAVAGDCDDVGAAYPPSGQVIGRVLSTNGGAGTYSMVLFPPEIVAGGGAGGVQPSASGTVAARPAAAAGNLGQIYYPTDSVLQFRSTGAAWESWWVSPLRLLTVPASASYAWVNQGGSSVSDAQGYMILTGAIGANPNLRILSRALPAANTYTIIAAMWAPIYRDYANNWIGCGLRDNVGGGLVVLKMDGNASRVSYSKYTSPTVFSADYTILAESNSQIASSPLWVKLVDDNVNQTAYISRDGMNWSRFYQRVRTNFITPDHFFFAVNNNGTSPDRDGVVGGFLSYATSIP